MGRKLGQGAVRWAGGRLGRWWLTRRAVQYGTVKSCVDSAGTEWAVKILKKSVLRRKRTGMRPDQNALNDVRREIAIMKELDHPNVVNLVEVIDDPDSVKLYLIQEFVGGGQLMESSFEDIEPIHLLLIRPYLRQILMGCEYLHFQGFLHRDIKPVRMLPCFTCVLLLTPFSSLSLSFSLAPIAIARPSLCRRTSSSARTATSSWRTLAFRMYSPTPRR